MTIPQFDDEGFLPPGRYRALGDEVRARFVDPYPPDSPRRAIWEDWLTVTELLKATVGTVCAAWIGGSFLSAKPAPDDIDSLYVVPEASLAAIAETDPRAKTLQLVTGHGPHGIRARYGLRVDTYLLSWALNPAGAPRTQADVLYCQWRGYWDDFWLRRRSGAKMDVPRPEDALPRRGYVEVILDGYNV
ncbi:MAG: hypothetical protein LBG60_10930 [Bifidobacteriaceae bacterium]|nr:hypothetical protein [Bifidobacteriaceae bacterium]